MSWIKEQASKTGKMLYVVLYHSLSQQEIIESLKSTLKKINLKMKDPYKRKMANDRLYSLETYISNKWLKEKPVNSIFFINDNKIDHYLLTKAELSVCKLWNLPKEIIKYDKEFDIDYFESLLDGNNYHHVFRLDKMSLKYIHLSKHKQRVIRTCKISSANSEKDLKEKCQIESKANQHAIVHGQGSLLKKLEISNMTVFPNVLSNEAVLEFFFTREMRKNHSQLKECIDYMQHPEKSDLIIVGKKEISNAITNYMIKMLFITPKLLFNLKKKIGSEYLNFKIIEISRIEKGDLFQTFVKDFGGLLGVLYYK